MGYSWSRIIRAKWKSKELKYLNRKSWTKVIQINKFRLIFNIDWIKGVTKR